MVIAQTLIQALEDLAPLSLAERWDNVGLLLGDRQQEVQRVMTCLTLTSDVADEAVREKAGLIVSHHPVLFKPVQRLTSDTEEGRILLQLARAGCVVYSPHTAFDSARLGVNQQIAEGLGLLRVRPIRPTGAVDSAVGGGRYGRLPGPLKLTQLISQARQLLRATSVQIVGDSDKLVETVAVACGSAAEFLTDAARLECDVLLTGEARFHACLEARALSISLVLLGHFATERPAVEKLADLLSERCPGVHCWASRAESDPMREFR